MHPCKSCNSRIGEGVYCLTCERQLGICQQPAAATLRAVYERAFWAGIANDLCMEFAHRDALVIVRQWPAMTAERDALIAKAVQG